MHPLPVKKKYHVLSPVLLFFACMLCQFAHAQWTISGNDISNTNPGNVGIGTSNPREKFQIGDRFTIQDGGWKGIMYNMAWSPALNTNVRQVDGPSSAIYFTSDGSIILQNGPSNLAGSITNDVHWSMYLNSSGQVSIGTSDPKNYLFAVNGPAVFTKVVVKQYANWPDYVFKKDYQLPPLPTVAQYIRKHNHLPGIPSADSVAKNGIDLGAGQAVLLKKIEELTLYAITQNEQLEAQAKQLGVQNKKLAQQQQEIDELKEMVKRLLDKTPAPVSTNK